MKNLFSKKILIPMVLLLLVTALSANQLADRTVEYLQTNGISPILIIVIISMLPLIELRGSIPVAILLFKMSWQEAVLISMIGNMIPIPFILLFMDWFFRQISRFGAGKKFTNWLFTRTRSKSKKIEKYEAWGLTLFVGVPLPGTGAWTGAFAANIMGLKFWKSMLCIALGVLIAAGIMTTLSLFTNMFA